MRRAGGLSPRLSNPSYRIPDPLPPGAVVRHWVEVVSAHLLPDHLDVPAGQRRECLRLLLVPLAQRPTILGDRVARIVSAPRMPKHVSSLEVGPVTGFLEAQVVWEVLRIVSHVQAG